MAQPRGGNRWSMALVRNEGGCMPSARFERGSRSQDSPCAFESITFFKGCVQPLFTHLLRINNHAMSSRLKKDASARMGGPSGFIVVGLLLSAGYAAAYRDFTTPGAGQSGPELLQWLELFASMPPSQQALLLNLAGVTLQGKLGMDCNIFGGSTACKAIPANSTYIQQCGARAQQRADCVYHDSITSNLYDSPVDDLEDYLASSLGPGIKQYCPSCFDKVQDLWCALAVPSCGTFSKQVEKGLLPVLSQSVKVYSNNGIASRADAISTIMTSMLDIFAAGLPCREMCDAVTVGCSCHPATETLGSLLTWMASQPKLQGKLPLTYTRTLFKKLWDKPFCELFPSRAESGTCPIPAATPAAAMQCSDTSRWCELTSPPKSDTFRLIQSLLLLQYVRATSNWLTDDNAIIWGIHGSMNDAVTEAESISSSRSSSSSDTRSVGQVLAIVFLALIMTVLAAAGLVVVVRWWKDRAAEKSYMELAQHEDEYTRLTT